MTNSRSRRRAASLFLLVAVALAAACGSSGNKSGFAPTSDGGASDGTTTDSPSGGDDGGTLIGEGGLGTATSLAITPANSTITVTSLTSPQTETLTAKVTYSGGATANAAASWTIDLLDIASISGAGTVTPTGSTFGKATVTAKAAGLTATTTVTVALKLVVAGPTIPTSSQNQLTGATATDPSVTAFAYPYDQTVFPLGLLPPEIQWDGGSAGDDYLLHFTGPNLDLEVFTTADPPSRYTLTPSLWNTVTTTAAGANVSLALSRLSGGVAYKSAAESWSIANADLRGIIYYWAINEGQIVQLDLANGTLSPAFTPGSSMSLDAPTPINSSSATTPPWEDNGSGSRCVACHSVSKDGSTLVSVFSRDQPGSTGPTGVITLANQTITNISDYTTDGIYNALTPDGSLMVVDYSGKTMGLLSTASAMPVASALDGQMSLCDPAFSPDGTLFALASDCDPGFGYPVEFRTSNLTLYSFSPTVSPYFTNPFDVEDSTGVGDAIAFPSFSPDSKWVFYQRGDYSRAKYNDTSGNPTHGNDDIYVAPASASSTQIALDNLNGTAYLPTVDLDLNYAPTVNPISVGGYFWVVFTSPRDYGNEMVAPGSAYPDDPTYANNKQLWVAAIDANIGTTDPSHPPFWLPGQDGTSANFFGYWALAPCKATPTDGGTQSCTAGFECCSGFCVNGSCATQSPGCSMQGDKCTMTSDCCTTSGSNIACIGGFCEPQSPQ
jgi:hypothetical protein